MMLFKGLLTTLVTKFKCLGVAHRPCVTHLPPVTVMVTSSQPSTLSVGPHNHGPQCSAQNTPPFHLYSLLCQLKPYPAARDPVLCFSTVLLCDPGQVP